ncbi:TlpA disulfide reductase family protein [uncultured Shewanella sp.]|uniref:TlpA family protein disulfide reductase n=1 Tax=uncultured Shewanella sp. TaxID=173975 RepID=UPI00261E6702|nr:TlpA disulfide reductase family protein [uncultured Shewanella sp.]
MNKVKLALVTGGIVMSLLVAGCSHHQGHVSQDASLPVNEAAKYQTYVKVGQSVPVNQFIDIQGRHIDLMQSKHKKILILFATWCPDSQRAMKALVQSALIHDDTIDIIGIGREESIASLSQFALDYQLPFSLVADKGRSLYRQFASAGIPRFILLDEHNKIVKTLLLEDDIQVDKLLAPIQW